MRQGARPRPSNIFMSGDSVSPNFVGCSSEPRYIMVSILIQGILLVTLVSHLNWQMALESRVLDGGSPES